MQISAKWKEGFEHICKADAQIVANEIQGIGEDASPEQIVEKAKDETTELHKCFEWNDTIAAEKYRIQQAGWIIRHIVIQRTEDEIKKDMPEIRRFVKTDYSSGYKPIEIVVKKKDEYEILLKNAIDELHCFRRKYSRLSELEAVFAAIDEVA